jgi:anti-sigma regulatory factor (Ser/Thr protein kinase)
MPVSAGVGSTVELECHMSNVSAARRFVRSELGGRAPEPVLSDLMLVTSELVTNAFEHGSGSVVLTVRSDDDGASVTVTSRGEADTLPDVDSWTTARADRISGRGLGIVRQIADDIDVERSADTIVITVHRRFSPPG